VSATNGNFESQTATFLEAAYGGVPDGLSILVWTLADKASHWSNEWQGAARDVELLRGASDVYVGVGLSPRDFGPSNRCKANDVAGLVGLWADVDVAGPGHKHQNLPADEAAARALIDKLELPPSYVIHTGGGLHAWWLFAEPWTFDDDAERQRAQALSQAWQRTVQAHARAAGASVDGTHDLSRVLRVPGTYNRKTAPARPCRIVEARAAARYQPADFDPYLVSPAEATAAARVDVGPLALTPGAEPPWAKLVKLFAEEPQAHAAFLRRRPDLADQSPSAYDMSLANYLVRAHFTDQEIADTLIAARRQAGEDLKLDRQDYYGRLTIGKVRSELRQSTAAAEAVEFLRGVDPRADLSDADQRGEILGRLSAVIGTQIVRIVKYKIDPPQYRLQTAAGEVELGTVNGLIFQTKFRAAIAAAQGHYMPAFKPKDWDPIAQWLLSVCEEEDVGPDGSDRGIVLGWLHAYLERNPPGPLDEANFRSRKPFEREGRVCLFGDDFRRFLLRKYQERLGSKEMGRLFRKCGGRSLETELRIGGKRRSAMVWSFDATAAGVAQTLIESLGPS
jgi:hypothetical protein